MITFYPGPSKVYPVVEQYLQEAFHEGVLSINHRSPACMNLTRSAIDLLHEKLHIPADYTIYFISSATEVWEIIAQSLTKRHSLHLYNGAFGEKWADYAERIVPQVTRLGFDLEVPLASVPLPLLAPDVVCLTQNETSNGTQVTDWSIVAEQYPDALLAVDTTSSMAGVQLDWQQADVWFASVQKCFGLPAGMAIMVCSPKAMQRAFEIGDRKYYNSLWFIHYNFVKFQTHYTPNVLAIYLLAKVLALQPSIDDVAQKIRTQAQDWYAFFEEHFHGTKSEGIAPLVQNKALRSDTVITISARPSQIIQIKNQFQSVGITVGNGYGTWKDSTFRIANFPAISSTDIWALKEELLKLSYIKYEL